MTTARYLLATAAVALLAWLGASAALGSAPASTDARASVPATSVAVVQAPAGASRPTAADVHLATTTARREVPGAPVEVVVVTGTLDAQGTVARLAAERADSLLVGVGPATTGALAAARSAWPQLRAVSAR